MNVLVIPDTQCSKGAPVKHLKACCNYIIEKRPEVIVHLGDHWDMPSLSSYEKRGSHYFEGKRYKADMEAGNEGMKLLSGFQSIKGYSPRLYLLRGNHENRVNRAVNEDPRLEGVIGEHDMLSPGWQVVPFLKVLKLRDVWFSHYFAAPLTGRAYGGTAHNLLQKVGKSFVQGHRQGLDSAVRQMADGSSQRGLISGSFYLHSESYRGPQGTGEWRGVVMLNNFGKGTWSQCEVDIDWLLRNYG